MGVSGAVPTCVFILLLIINVYETQGRTPTDEVETTSILQQIDRGVNPCDDFYQFTCGNATHLFKIIRQLSDVTERRMLEIYNEPITDNDHHMVQTVKKLFRACMDVAAIEKEGVNTIKEVLNKLGGWPILLGSNWNDEKFDWVSTTYKLRELGYMFPVYLDVLVDKEKDAIYEVSLPRAHYYVVGNSTEVTAYMLKIATAFGADREQAISDIEDIAELGEDLQEFVDNYAESKRKSVKIIVDDFQNAVESVDWLEFINKIISPAVHISKRDTVVFPNSADLKLWLSKIEERPKRVQANYMLWKVVEQIIPYLGADLQRYKHQGKRSDMCLKEIERRFPISPISIMYLRKYLPKTKKTQVEHMVDNIKSELVQAINKFDWLSREEQRVSVDKLNRLQLILGLPGDYFGDDMLNQLSVDMKPVQNESLLELLAQANRNLEAQKYTGAVTKFGFPGRNYLINYESKRNLIYIPAALLQAPLYDETKPNYLNYGHIGLLISGELSGIFQTKDTSNPEKQQLSNSTTVGVIKMRECVLSDYDSQVFSGQTDLSSVRTIQEYVIAQRVVYDAYTKWAKNNGDEAGLPGASYSSHQLFWISTVFCDPKSVSEKSIQRQFADFRVYTSLRNNYNFTRDYNCASGARMNPVRKCQIY